MKGITMEKYSIQMINEIADDIDPTIADFCKRYFPNKDLHEIILDAIETKLDPVANNVRFIYDKEKANRKKKRQHWYEKTLANLERYDISKKESYFHDIMIRSLQHGEYYEQRYGTTNINMIINFILDEMIEWKKNSDYLIKFPNFPYIGNINIQRTIESDIFTNICLIVIQKYNGNLQSWSIKQPYATVVNPIFSAQHGRVSVKKVNGKLVANIFSSEEYDVAFTDIPFDMSENYDMSIPVFDQRDLEITSFLMNNTIIDFKETSYLGNKQRTTIGAIANAVCHTNKPSQAQRENVARRLMRLTTPIAIHNKNDGFYQSWVLLDYITIYPADNTGQRVVEYILGSKLSDELIQNRLACVSTSRYHDLSTDYSRTIYYKLQMERIRLSVMGENTCFYSYQYFIKAMLLRYRSVTRIKKIIIDALTEVMEKSIVIKSFDDSISGIKITYLPLSELEKSEFIGDNK